MGLIVKNIGGARKGVEDMGVLGNPGKYTMVLGENKEGSPWEPHHVAYGFDANANTVTVSFPNGYVQIVPRGSDVEGILRTIKTRLGPRWRQVTVITAPSHAATMAEAGWSKAQLIAHLEQSNPDQPSNLTRRGLSGPESVRVIWPAVRARGLAWCSVLGGGSRNPCACRPIGTRWFANTETTSPTICGTEDARRISTTSSLEVVRPV